MLIICDNTIKVCKFKAHAKKVNGNEAIEYDFYIKDEQELDETREKLESKGYIVTYEEFNIDDEIWLDGKPCSSLALAQSWLADGEITKPITLDSLVEIVADIIGGVL